MTEQQKAEDEKRIRDLEYNYMLMQKDIHLMSQSLQKMADSMERLAEVSNRQIVLEERCETRHNEMKSSIKKVHERVDTLQLDVGSLKTKEVEKEEVVGFVKDFQKLLWGVVKWVVISLLGLIGVTIMYVIKVGGIQ